MWIKAKLEGIFFRAYGPGSEGSEGERERIFGVNYQGVLKKRRGVVVM